VSWSATISRTHVDVADLRRDVIAPALWTLAIVTAVVVNWAAVEAYDHVISPRIEDSDPDPVEGLKRDYEEGSITLDEFEVRVELHLDDRAQETRQRLERIDDIGLSTKTPIKFSTGSRLFRNKWRKVVAVSTKSEIET